MLDPVLLRRLIDGSNLAIQIYRLEDPDDLASFRLLVSNRAVAKHTGLTDAQNEALVGLTFREIAQALLPTDTPRRYREVLDTGVPATLDIVYGHGDYPTTVFRVHAWRIGERTLAIAFFNVTREIETQRRLDEHVTELQRAYADLETSRERQVQVEKLASLGQMSAGVAHEINNPLLVVKGYAAHLRELLAAAEPPEPAAVERALGFIERSCARIESIANRMSFYARHAGRSRQRLRVNAILREVVELLRPTLDAHRVGLLLDLCPGEPEIAGDELRLEQLLVNLLLNARDAIASDGGRGNGNIAITSRCDERSMRISVHDDGCGIPDHVQRKMFDPFFSTKPPGRGTGLGLSIVHEITEELGGRIECDSRVGVGTTFSLTVPLLKADVAAGLADDRRGV